MKILLTSCLTKIIYHLMVAMEIAVMLTRISPIGFYHWYRIIFCEVTGEAIQILRGDKKLVNFK